MKIIYSIKKQYLIKEFSPSLNLEFGLNFRTYSPNNTYIQVNIDIKQRETANPLIWGAEKDKILGIFVLYTTNMINWLSNVFVNYLFWLAKWLINYLFQL